MNFVNFMAFIRTYKKCLLQNLSSKGGTLVGMRWSAVNIIPGPIATVAKNLCRFAPGPKFYHAVQPEIQMKGSNVTAQSSDLLPACTFIQSARKAIMVSTACHKWDKQYNWFISNFNATKYN